MSEEDVERLRELYESAVDDEFSSLFALLDDDVEYVNPDNALEPGIRRGRPETEGALRRLFETFVYSRIVVERVAEVGDRVVAILDVEGRGRDSGTPFQVRFGHLVTFRDGRIVRFEWFLNPAEALEAAGLRE
jgi:ketosteroid isomerase-like protein